MRKSYLFLSAYLLSASVAFAAQAPAHPHDPYPQDLKVDLRSMLNIPPAIEMSCNLNCTVGQLRKEVAKQKGWDSPPKHVVLSWKGKKLEDDTATLRQIGFPDETLANPYTIRFLLTQPYLNPAAAQPEAENKTAMAAPKEQSLKVHLRTIVKERPQLEIDCNPEWTVGKLRAEVSKANQWDTSRIVLMWKGKKLEDDTATLSQIGFPDETAMHSHTIQYILTQPYLNPAAQPAE